jgi:hypothetical protein
VEKEKHFEIVDIVPHCLPMKPHVDPIKPVWHDSLVVDSDDSDIELLRSSPAFGKNSSPSQCDTKGKDIATMVTVPILEDRIASTPTAVDDNSAVSAEMVDDIAQGTISTTATDNQDYLAKSQQPCSPPHVAPLPNVTLTPLFTDRLFQSLDNLYLHADIDSVYSQRYY